MALKNYLRKPADFIVLLLFIVLISFTTYLFLFRQTKPVKEHLFNDLAEIFKRDTLIAITDNSSTSYFLYKGEPMGYQYELLTKFSEHLGVALKIITVTSIEESFIRLKMGDADLIAMDLTVTAPRNDLINFSKPISETRQVVVQRKHDGNSAKTDKKNVADKLIKPADLNGKTIYVQKNSSHSLRLKNLAEENGVDLTIVEMEQESDDLIAMVSEGEIDFTLADIHVAMANSTWYDNIDLSLEVSLPQEVAWAIKPGSDSLELVLNQWIEGFIRTKQYAKIYNRYFVNKKAAHLKNAEFHSVKGKKLSPYDDLIKTNVENTPWDWRFIAAVIYEESRFNPKAQSWAGAQGLMQLMPGTARKFGVKNLNSPDEQIKGGINLLSYLNEKLPEEIYEPEERTRYILACYNIGMSHIMDAFNLAVKYGEDPSKWEVAEKYLLLKSKPKYFNDPVVKGGYARGRETRKFVQKVYKRFIDYKNTLPE